MRVALIIKPEVKPNGTEYSKFELNSLRKFFCGTQTPMGVDLVAVGQRAEPARTPLMDSKGKYAQIAVHTVTQFLFYSGGYVFVRNIRF